jgi:hypothetical protein
MSAMCKALSSRSICCASDGADELVCVFSPSIGVPVPPALPWLFRGLGPLSDAVVPEFFRPRPLTLVLIDTLLLLLLLLVEAVVVMAAPRPGVLNPPAWLRRRPGGIGGNVIVIAPSPVCVSADPLPSPTLSEPCAGGGGGKSAGLASRLATPPPPPPPPLLLLLLLGRLRVYGLMEPLIRRGSEPPRASPAPPAPSISTPAASAPAAIAARWLLTCI